LNIALSMLFSLSESFSDMLKHLTQFDINYVELVDESWHALNKKRVNTLKRIARESDIEFTVHAPFVDINIASPNPGLRRVMLKRLKRSMINVRQLRCRQWTFSFRLEVRRQRVLS
jgi:sugar phosphate isomerase/epimerase